MTYKRFILALRSLNRMVEIFRCLRMSQSPVREMLAYLEFRQLVYPYRLKLKSGQFLDLDNWEDLTTAWVVFYGEEYSLWGDERTIVDLGANIGAFSILASSRLPSARVIAVEPFPSTYKRLLDTIRHNNMREKITAVNAAAVGECRSVIMDDGDGVASHSRKIGALHGVSVEGYTIEMLMDEHSLEFIDLLKVDIEGAEYELIEKTPRDVLQKIKRIGLEYHGNGDTTALFDKLKASGFKMGRFPKKGKFGVVEFIQQ